METLQDWLNEGGIVAILCIGGLLVLLGREGWTTWRFLRRSIRTTAEISAYKVREATIRHDDQDIVRDVYDPVLRYTDQAGASHTFHGPMTTSPKPHTIGTTLPIRYVPQQDMPPRIDSIRAIYGRPLTLLIILVVVLVLTLTRS